MPWLFELAVKDRQHLLREITGILGQAVLAQLQVGDPAEFPGFLTVTPRFEPESGVRLEATVDPQVAAEVQRTLGAEWLRESREWGLRPVGTI